MKMAPRLWMWLRLPLISYVLMLTVTVALAYGSHMVAAKVALKLWLWWLVMAASVYVCMANPKSARRWLLAFAVICAIDIAAMGVLFSFYGNMPIALVLGDAVAAINPREVIEFVTSHWRLIAISVGWLLLQVAAFTFWYHNSVLTPHYLAPKWQAKSPLTKVAIVTLLLTMVALHLSSTMQRNHPVARWALLAQHYYANKHAQQHLQQKHQQLQQQAALALAQRTLQPPTSPRRLILVIGESSNRHNWSAYGYPRPTTAPLADFLQHSKGATTWFTQARSALPSTIPSLTTAFTTATASSLSTAMDKPDILTQLLHAGFAHSVYLSTQPVEDIWLTSIGKSFSHSHFINHGNSRTATVTDFDLLPIIKSYLYATVTPQAAHPAAIAKNPPPAIKPPPQTTANELLVIHLLGQHFSYAARCPTSPQYQRFNADTKDVVNLQLRQAGRFDYIISQRSHYDNALYCGAILLKNIIAMAQDSATLPTAVVFFSDHGQEVGHNSNHAGHSSKYDSGYTVPAFVWTSDNWTQPWSRQRAQQPFSVANIDNLLVELAGIQSPWTVPLKAVPLTPQPR